MNIKQVYNQQVAHIKNRQLQHVLAIVLSSRVVTGLIIEDYTLRRHLYVMEQRRKPQPMFCVSVKPWLHTHTYFGSFFFWTQRMLEVYVWGQSGTLVKEQGSHDVDIRLWDTKGLSRRRKCVGTERAQTHVLFCCL